MLRSPDILYGSCFQLSFIAVIFIGFAVERDDDKEEIKRNRLFRHVKQSVLLNSGHLAGHGTSRGFLLPIFLSDLPAGKSCRLAVDRVCPRQSGSFIFFCVSF